MTLYFEKCLKNFHIFEYTLNTHLYMCIVNISFDFRHKGSSSDESQSAELEEAQKTTYVRGQWVMTGSDMDDVQYSVVEPCIPNSGDYSAYATWCKFYRSFYIIYQWKFRAPFIIIIIILFYTFLDIIKKFL